MYNILVVDDEDIIRRGTSKALQNLGDFNVFEAAGGNSAIEVVLHNSIDAMFLDISMKDMDGIELMEWLCKENLNPIVMIISGYDKFDYAQKAMKYGAVEFVLKPLCADDIRSKGLKMKELLDARSERKNEIRLLRDEVGKSKQILKERFLTDVIEGRMNGCEFKKKLNFLGLKIQGNFFRVAVLEIEKGSDAALESEEDSQIFLKSIENFINGKADSLSRFEVFHNANNCFILLFSWEDEPKGLQVFSLLDLLMSETESHFGVTVTIGIGDPCQGADKIPVSYKQALYSVNVKMLLGPGYIFSLDDFNKDEISKDFDEFVTDFRNALNMLQPYKALSSLGKAFDYMESRKQRLNPFSIQFYSFECLTAIISIMQRYNIEITSVFEAGTDPFKDLADIRSISGIREWLSRNTIKLNDCLTASNNHRRQDLAEMIENFVDIQFQSNITVSSLAETFSYSPNYLGNSFKEISGMTINEYVNKIRVDKAKELLRTTDVKVFEIASRVGFNDQHYFSQVFKRQAGYSPKQYKEMTTCELSKQIEL